MSRIKRHPTAIEKESDEERGYVAFQGIEFVRYSQPSETFPQKHNSDGLSRYRGYSDQVGTVLANVRLRVKKVLKDNPDNEQIRGIVDSQNGIPGEILINELKVAGFRLPAPPGEGNQDE